MDTMGHAYIAPLVVLPIVINRPGTYRTRGGGLVLIKSVSRHHDFKCCGTYRNGTADGWHKSGRLYATSLSQNDIVTKA